MNLCADWSVIALCLPGTLLLAFNAAISAAVLMERNRSRRWELIAALLVSSVFAAGQLTELAESLKVFARIRESSSNSVVAIQIGHLRVQGSAGVKYLLGTIRAARPYARTNGDGLDARPFWLIFESGEPLRMQVGKTVSGHAFLETGGQPLLIRTPLSELEKRAKIAENGENVDFAEAQPDFLCVGWILLFNLFLITLGDAVVYFMIGSMRRRDALRRERLNRQSEASPLVRGLAHDLRQPEARPQSSGGHASQNFGVEKADGGSSRRRAFTWAALLIHCILLVVPAELAVIAWWLS